MFKGSPDPDERAYLAKAVADKLGPVVRQASQAGTNVSLPADLRAAGEDGAAPGRNTNTNDTGAGVQLDDLKDLLPKE